jgi:hypothetical protein
MNGPLTSGADSVNQRPGRAATWIPIFSPFAQSRVTSVQSGYAFSGQQDQLARRHPDIEEIERSFEHDCNAALDSWDSLARVPRRACNSVVALDSRLCRSSPSRIAARAIASRSTGVPQQIRESFRKNALPEGKAARESRGRASRSAAARRHPCRGTSNSGARRRNLGERRARRNHRDERRRNVARKGRLEPHCTIGEHLFGLGLVLSPSLRAGRTALPS